MISDYTLFQFISQFLTICELGKIVFGNIEKKIRNCETLQKDPTRDFAKNAELSMEKKIIEELPDLYSS